MLTPRGKLDTVQLHFERPSSSPSPSPSSFALFNWFAVHPTSMNFTNHLISGDHKGTASQFVEQSNAASAVGPGQVRACPTMECAGDLQIPR